MTVRPQEVGQAQFQGLWAPGGGGSRKMVGVTAGFFGGQSELGEVGQLPAVWDFPAPVQDRPVTGACQ